jgi:hypothetical protein
MKCLSAKEYTTLYKIVIEVCHKTPIKYPTVHSFRINSVSEHGSGFGSLNIKER